MKNLPIGIQSLIEIKRTNSIYVDKTQLIYQLATSGKAYFLSRPRRFGKSLTVSVLKELFEGNKPLFEGLWIENNWDWSQKSPVIRISFADLDYQAIGLSEAIIEYIDDIAKEKGITLTKKSVKSKFKELLNALYEKEGRVVLLVDEYDKPIVQYLENQSLPQAIKNREILKGFYSILKEADEILRFVFITGVSKFTKVSIFSDLNHLNDISISPKYAALTGYTQEELEQCFSEYLQLAISDFDISMQKLLDHIKLWYNGYTWDGKTAIYNPFGTLLFLSNRVFKNYWFATGTPTFLVEQMKLQGRLDISPIKVKSSFFEKYDLENLEISLLLFQTGYLTIKEIDRFNDSYLLDFPNKEVKDSLFDFFLYEFTRQAQKPNSGLTADDLRQAFERKDLERVKLILNAYLAELPHEVYRHSSEGLYHGLIHITFTYLGTMIQSEVHSSYGQADAVVQTDTDVYIFEFKFNKSAQDALTQIETKKYAEKYRTSGKTIIGIGVNFNDTTKQIDDWLEKTL